MKKIRRKKRAITLIEIMIVILLIGLIGGALAYNMSGSLDEGKAFKTRQNIEKVHDILMLEYAQSNQTLENIKTQWEDIIKASSLVTKKQRDELLYDGWKEKYSVSIVNDDLCVVSNKLIAYEAKKKK